MPYFHTTAGNVYYERHGQSGPVIILLHGLASSSRIWLRQVKGLQDFFQVYVLDLPGHGRSDHWPDYSFEAFSQLLKDWMDACGIQQASFVALSLGCTLALTFSSQYPDRVNSLVLEGPIGGYDIWWSPLGWPDRLVFTIFPILLKVSVLLFGHHATAHWLNTFGVRRKRNFKVLESVQSQADFRVIRQLLWQSACPPYIGHLSSIVAPVLIVRGCNDPMPKRFVRYIQTHLSQVTLVEVPQTRHLVALEKPREFNRLIHEFLAQTLAKPEQTTRKQR